MHDWFFFIKYVKQFMVCCCCFCCFLNITTSHMHIIDQNLHVWLQYYYFFFEIRKNNLDFSFLYLLKKYLYFKIWIFSWIKIKYKNGNPPLRLFFFSTCIDQRLFLCLMRNHLKHEKRMCFPLKIHLTMHRLLFIYFWGEIVLSRS